MHIKINYRIKFIPIGSQQALPTGYDIFVFNLLLKYLQMFYVVASFDNDSQQKRPENNRPMHVLEFSP
jgi:formate hydrogenlyase subunit 4